VRIFGRLRLTCPAAVAGIRLAPFAGLWVVADVAFADPAARAIKHVVARGRAKRMALILHRIRQLRSAVRVSAAVS
jgi:hypothetical protein